MNVRGRRDQLGPRLFDPPPVDESTLTERQAFALQELRDNPAGLTSEQLGRAVHDYFLTSHAGACQWCGSTGLALLKSLKARDLVAQHRGGLYQAVTHRGQADASDSAASFEGEEQEAPVEDDGSFDAFMRGAG